MEEQARACMQLGSVRPRIPVVPRLANVLMLGILLHPALGLAQCSDEEVRRYHEKGNTIAGIAELCDMEPEEIRDLLRPRRELRGSSQGSATTRSGSEEDEGGWGESPRQGLPPGQPVMQCGCWGNVYPGAQFPNQACQSGYAVAAACPAYCPTGGYMWYAACR